MTPSVTESDSDPMHLYGQSRNLVRVKAHTLYYSNYPESVWVFVRVGKCKRDQMS